ncbi:MAG: BamA/TamA family outer membrane protein [Gemmatimonadaceae bacterium]|nr:BamA/TamA family outer membrane protein [Gemmatimonadaceae bacterium]
MLTIATVVLASLASATPVAAQLLRRRGVQDPVIRTLRIEGNQALPREELEANILTEASACRSLLVTPLCWVAKPGFLFARRRLDRAELERDVLRLRVHYYRRGFRASRIVPRVIPVDSATVDVLLAITEGPPTTIARLDLGPADTILSARTRRAILGDLAPGRPVDLIQLDTVGLRATAALDERGYGDATVIPAVVEDSTSPTREVRLVASRTYPTFVERVRVEGTERYDPRLVANTLLQRPGDRYTREGTAESQRALYEIGNFRRAVVRTEPGSADSLKVLVAQVEELEPRSVRLTGGVSTVDFFQVDARWINANWRNNGTRLTLQGTLGNLGADFLNNRGPFLNVLPRGPLPRGDTAATREYLIPTWQANAEVRRRWLRDPRNQTALGIFGYRRAAPGVFVDEGYGASATFTRDVMRRWPVSATYRFELTGVRAVDTYFCVNFGVCDTDALSVLRRRQRLSPIALTTSVDRRDDPIGPTRGWAFRAEAEHAARYTLSDLWYSRIEAEITQYVPLADRITLGLHGRAGVVRGAANPRFGGEAIIHPRRRFYAGGAQSVRGYGENQLGPRVLAIPVQTLRDTLFTRRPDGTQQIVRLGCDLPDDQIANCPVEPTTVNGQPAGNYADLDFVPKPVGGNAVAEASAEVRWRVWGPVTLAGFIDGGWVQSSSGGTTRAASVITPGIGARFVTPVGPIRLDLGFNPRPRELLTVITDVPSRNAAGEATSTLTTLANPRSFNPATGTGLGGIFNRLTLHLSVGEAF